MALRVRRDLYLEAREQEVRDEVGQLVRRKQTWPAPKPAVDVGQSAEYAQRRYAEVLRPQFPAGHPSPEGIAQDSFVSITLIDNSGAVVLGEMLPLLDVYSNRRLMIRHDVHVHADQSSQYFDRSSALGRGRLPSGQAFLDEVGVNLEQQRILVPDVPVQRAFGDPSGRGDLIRCGSLEALTFEKGHRGLEDSSTTFLLGQPHLRRGDTHRAHCRAHFSQRYPFRPRSSATAPIVIS